MVDCPASRCPACRVDPANSDTVRLRSGVGGCAADLRLAQQPGVVDGSSAAPARLEVDDAGHLAVQGEHVAGVEVAVQQIGDTWNAESNAHMIAINEQLGYHIVRRYLTWQQELT